MQRPEDLRGARRLALALLVTSGLACNQIAGIGAPTLEDPDASPARDVDASAPKTDASLPLTPDAEPPVDEASTDAGAPGPDASAADSDIPDANGPDTFTPPPPAAKPGYDVTAGGTYGKSASFSLIGVVGESPGGVNVGKSKSFVLKAGVIAVTQPN